MSNLEKDIYLVFSRDQRKWNKPLKTPRLTVNQPTLKRGEVAVKLTVLVPVKLFETFIPSGILHIPTDMAASGIEVEVPTDIDVADDEIRLRLVPFRGGMIVEDEINTDEDDGR